MSNREPSQQDLDDQYRRPTGELGRRIGGDMARDHLPENLWTLAQLDPQPGERILEVGFGPGVAVEEVLKRVPGGLVAGVDFSETMVDEARARNAEAVRAGRADLRQGDAERLPFDDNSFDRAYSVHSIYFWPNPAQALREFRRVLRPGGLLVITGLPREKWPPNPPGSALEYGTPECTPYSGGEIARMMVEAGFSEARIAGGNDPERLSNFSVLGTKPPVDG